MLAVFFALASSGASAPPTPMGVNDTVLGAPEEFSLRGPDRLCLSETSIDLGPGETSYLEYSGIHSLRVVIQSAAGQLKLEEGGSWKRPRSQRLVFRRADLKVYEFGDEREFRYVVYRESDEDEGGFRPFLRIDGDILRGNRSDRRVFERLGVSDEAMQNCRVRLNYGWDVILNGAPLMERKQ